MNSRGRLAREKRTVRIMIEVFCKAHHHPDAEICDKCEELSLYAARKIERCPFHEAKPVCAQCRIHCYGNDMREQIRRIMRYSGPRMIFSHPGLAALHVLDEMRKPPRKG